MPDATQIIFEQTLPFSSLLIIMIAAAALLITLTFWQRPSTPRLLTATLITLRLVAIITCLNMFAGITEKQITTHYTQPQIDIYIDTSASMKTLDIPNPDNPCPVTGRWQIASQNLSHPIVTIDSTVTLLNTAQQSLISARHLITQSQNPTDPLYQAIISTTAAAKLLADTNTLQEQIINPLNALHQKSVNNTLLVDPRLDIQLAAIQQSLTQHTTRLTQSINIPSTPKPVATPTTRIQTLSYYLKNAQHTWLNNLPNNPTVQYHTFNTQTQSIPSPDRITTTPNPTNLDNLLKAIAENQQTADSRAAVIFTDANHTADTPLATSYPISASNLVFVPLGQTTTQPALDITNFTHPKHVYLNDQIQFAATIAANQYANQPIRIELYRNNKLIDTQRLHPESDFFIHPVNFTTPADSPGFNEYQLKIISLDTTPTTTADALIETRTRKLNVLLVDHLPRWEFRYLRNFLNQSPDTTCTALLLSNPLTSFLPDTPDKLKPYSVIILGDLPLSQLTDKHITALENHITSRGASLILIAGQNLPAKHTNPTFKNLLPVTLAQSQPPTIPITLNLTAQGHSFPALQFTNNPNQNHQLLQQLAANPTSKTLPTPIPTAHSLITTNTAPNQTFLAWHTLSQGKVFYLAAPTTHQLRHRTGDQYYNHFWQHLLRFAAAQFAAAQTDNLTLTTDQPRYQYNTPVTITVTLDNTDPLPDHIPLTASQNSATLTNLKLIPTPNHPDQYTATFTPPIPGLIQFTIAQSTLPKSLDNDISLTIAVDPPASAELRDTRCDLANLKQLAHNTNSLIAYPTALPALIQSIDTTATKSTHVTENAIWPKWQWIIIFGGCLVTDFLLRKVYQLA